ncbi:MAG: outer membrane receptor protein involved in Fe transport [Myxococcota bacterium]|jgi:outer membrane receptor protein involved in Fe transport
MQTPALLLNIFAVLALAMSPLVAIAQTPPSTTTPAAATAPADAVDAAADEVADSAGAVTPVAAVDEISDEELEALYGEQEADDNIEVMKVHAGESDGAADFETGDSVAAFDAADLEALGAQSIADLAAFTPNLEIVSPGATTPTFFIRGVGLNDINANSSGAVAIYFNDVAKNSPALQLGTLFDIESVNILRGPQGAGNYRSASAGAIKIYTKKPTGQYNSFFSSSFGNYNAVDVQGGFGAPIFEDILAGRFAFRFSDRDGYSKNGCGNADSFAERGVRTEFSSGKATDPEWSQCGEDVVREGFETFDGIADGRSHIQPGLPERVNDQHNWAARGTVLFQPTLDQEWLLTAQGGNRNELSALGQSLGTFKENGASIGTFGKSGRGVLGAPDGSTYVPREVEEARWALNPCLNNQTGEDHDDPNNIGVKRCTDLNRSKFSNFVSRSVLARDLARNLDDKPLSGDYNRPGKTKLETWGVSLKGDIVLADSIDLELVTGYDSYDRLINQDLDQSPNVNFETRTKDDGWQFTQSFEASGDVADDIPVRWTVGSLFLYEELSVAVAPEFGGVNGAIGVSLRDYRQKLWSGGAYGGFTFEFWEKFALDGGMRYNWERKSMNYLLQRASIGNLEQFARETWQAPSGTIRLTYNFKETTYAYWKYTRGWKGGHFNATGSDEGVTNADPEAIDSFEIGLHGVWFDGVVTFDVSLFHYNYQSYQLFTAQSNFDGQPEFVVLNASDAEVYGSELDLLIRPLPGTMVQARFAWLESQFLNYTQIQVERREFGFGNTLVLNNEIQNSGNPLLNSPRFKISLTAEQSVPLGRLGTLAVRWDGAWTAATNFGASGGRGVPNFEGDQFLPKNTIGQRSYWLHNARVGYTTPGGVEIAGWVRNFTDQTYKNFAFDVSSFNATTIFFVGQPRTYGMSLSATF